MSAELLGSQSQDNHSTSIYENVPEPIVNRIYGLKSIQATQHELEQNYHKEVLALERKYAELLSPLYKQRLELTSGESEPTSEQINTGKTLASKAIYEKNIPTKFEENAKGIPNFWLTCFKNNPEVVEFITSRDEDALSSLLDIKISHFPDNSGYSLVFSFASNAYFTNKELVKSFYFKASEPTGSIVVERSEGSLIEWVAGKDLTSITRTRKLSTNKTGLQSTSVKRQEPAESFFNIFSLDSSDCDDTQLSVEFRVGELIKDSIIPHAVDWYTGLALQYDDSTDGGLLEMLGANHGENLSSEEEELSDDSLEENDFTTKEAEVGPECKQQ